jgi:hypothetical protein
MARGKQATAEVQPDGKYLITHPDGSEELLTEGQFKAQYELEDEDPKVKGEAKSGTGTSSEPLPEEGDKHNVPPAVQGTQGPTGTVITSEIDGGQIGSVGGDEDPPTLAKEHRPETHDRDDAYWAEMYGDGEDFADEYCQAVNTELKELEEGIKAVRAELKVVDKQKPEERNFGALRDAMHNLAHGKSLLRTAHAATVRHDGPERLRPAPSAEDNISSGPGEETNYVEESTVEGRKQESRKAGR